MTPTLDTFRNVLGNFATGVVIVTAIDGGHPIGMTIQSFCSLSLDPPLVLICPSKSSSSWPRIAAAGGLCINFLAEDHEWMARQFAVSGGDKYANVDWTPSRVSHSPVIAGALAWIDGYVRDVNDGGDHIIVTCSVLDLDSADERRPLLFFRSDFRPVSER